MRRAAENRLPRLANRAGLACVALALLAASPRRAGADVIVLDNGARFEGRIVAEDGDGVVVEQRSGGSLSRILFERARIRSIERTTRTSDGRPAADSPTGRQPDSGGIAPPTSTGPLPAESDDPLPFAALPARDEWWLLEAGGRVLGTRRLVLIATERLVATGRTRVPGWRIEERLEFFARPRFPAVKVRRLEETTADFLPLSIHYAEHGDAEPEGGASGYDVLRSGPVKDGVWEASEQAPGGRTVTRAVEVPARARTLLGARETLARLSPRRPGLVDVPIVDAREGAVRVIRAGFTSIGAGDATVREDLLRVEDGERVLESRWVPGDPPRCVSEEIAPGVMARLVTQAQVLAAVAPRSTAPVAPTLDASPTAPAARRDVVHAELGFAYSLPGASWTSETPSRRGDDEGPRLVSTASSRTLMADLRVEWDPKGADRASSPETGLLDRLRRLAPDLVLVEPRAALSGRPSTVWLGLLGTRRGETLRMLVVAGDRGAGRVTMLLTCPETAWPDARPALDAIVASFRWI